MNKNFKVVFSKARNALMVVNEATASVQHKGAKTVIAAAVASLVAGAAMAEDLTIKLDPEATTATDAALVLIGGEGDSYVISDMTYGENAAASGTLSFDTEGRATVVGDFSKLTLTLGENFLGGTAIQNTQADTLVKNSTFTENKTNSRGGAIYTNNSMTVESSAFTGNSAANGGAFDIQNNDYAEGIKVSIEGSQFTKNTATTNGGAIRVIGDAGLIDLTISDSTFDQNTASTGSAIYAGSNVYIKLEDVAFTGNNATIAQKDHTNQHAGAVMLNGEKVKLEGRNVRFEGNTSEKGNGGALAVVGGANAKINGGSFTNNVSNGGGAVAVFNGSADFEDVDFIGNKSNGWGGAVMVDAEKEKTGSVYFAAVTKDVTISGNTSGDEKTLTGGRYLGHTGGFMHLKGGNGQGTVSAEFDVAEGRTMTIGTVGAAANVDSITSANGEATITKTGAGALVINSSMEAFEGTLNVEEGSLTMATGFGTYSIANQGNVNGTENLAVAAQSSALTVGTENTEASVTITGPWTVTGTMAVTVNEGSSLTTGDVTVATATYTDLVDPAKTTPRTGSTLGSMTVTGDATMGNIAVYGNGTSDAVATFTHQAGTLHAGNVTLGQAKTTTDGTDLKGAFSNSGTAEIGNLTFAVAGTKLTNTGDLYINGTVSTGELKSKDITVTNSADSVNGTIYTDFANLGTYTIDEDGALTVKKSVFGTAVTTGSLVDDSITASLTLDQYEALVGENGFSNLVLLKSAITANDPDETLDVSDVVGVTSPSTVATVEPGTGSTDAAIDVTKKGQTEATTDTVLANVDTTTAKKVTLKTDAESGLTLAGNNSVLFGAAAEEVVVTGESGLTLGYEDLPTSSSVNAKLTVGETGTASALNVVAGTFAANGGVELVKGDLSVTNATLAVKDGIKAGENDVTVTNGSLSTDWIEGEGTLTLSESVISIAGNVPQTTAPAIAPFALAAAPATPAVQPEPFENAIVFANKVSFDNKRGSVLGIGTASGAEALRMAVSALGEEAVEGKNTIVLNAQTKWESASGVMTFGDGTGYLTDLVIDLNGVRNTEGFSAEDGVMQGTIAGNSGTITLVGFNADVIHVDERTGAKSLKISTAQTATGMNVDFSSYVFGTTNEDANWIGYTTTKSLENGSVEVAVNEDFVQELYDSGLNLAGEVEAQANSLNFSGIASKIIWGTDEYFEGLEESWDKIAEELDAKGLTATEIEKAKDSYFDSHYEALVDAANTASNMAVYGGAFSTSFDINDQIRNTIDRRSSLANLNVARNATGITPWVDVMGTWNTADGLYGSSGYEADIYGATLGADYTASCGAILGAAISIGQADANSVDASTKVDNDVDFWGVSFYGSHRIGNVNGKFDIGYVSTSNDLSSSSAYFGTVKESLDADIFTVGVGAEYLATVGSLNVVPHAGIRWSSLDMDDSKYGADYDKMNLFQMPIGVAFSGTFDMTGWKVAPMLDISVVPTFGDKDAVASYTGGIKDTVRVVDSNPVQMTLGVNAQVDAWTLGVNYGLSAGSDERLNNAFNFNARYTF